MEGAPPCCAKLFPKEMHFGNVMANQVMDVFNSTNDQKIRELWFNNRAPKFCDKCHFLDIAPIELN